MYWPRHPPRIALRHGAGVSHRHQRDQPTRPPKRAALITTPRPSGMSGQGSCVRGSSRTPTASGELARARITDLEVGYPARNEAERDRLIAALDAFEPVESTESHHRRALQVQKLLAQRSQRPRSTRTDRLALRRRLRPYCSDRPTLPMGGALWDRRLERRGPTRYRKRLIASVGRYPLAPTDSGSVPQIR